MDTMEGEKTDAELGDMKYPFGDCLICEDKSTGVHYGVVACEGCKGFFKRSDVGNRAKDYRCYFGGNCPITPKTRNNCKACRYQKCLQFGMAMDAVKMGRIPKAEKIRALQLVRAKQREKEKKIDDNSDADNINKPKINNQTAGTVEHLNGSTEIEYVNGSTCMEYMNGSAGTGMKYRNGLDGTEFRNGSNGVEYTNGSTGVTNCSIGTEYINGSHISGITDSTALRSRVIDTPVYRHSRESETRHGVVRNGSAGSMSVNCHNNEMNGHYQGHARGSDRGSRIEVLEKEDEHSRPTHCTSRFPSPRDVPSFISERRPVPPINEKYLLQQDGGIQQDGGDPILERSESGRLHSSSDSYSSQRHCHRVCPYPEPRKSISDKGLVLPKKRSAGEEPTSPPRLFESSIFDVAGCVKSENFTNDCCHAQLPLSMTPVMSNYSLTNGLNNGCLNNGCLNNGLNNGCLNNSLNNGCLNNGLNNGCLNNGLNNGLHSNVYYDSSKENGSRRDTITNKHNKNDNVNNNNHHNNQNGTTMTTYTPADMADSADTTSPRPVVADDCNRVGYSTTMNAAPSAQPLDCSQISQDSPVPTIRGDDNNPFSHDNGRGPVNYSSGSSNEAMGVVRPDRVFSPRVIEWLAGLVYSDPESLLRTHHLLNSRLPSILAINNNNNNSSSSSSSSSSSNNKSDNNERRGEQRKRARYDEAEYADGRGNFSPKSAGSLEDRDRDLGDHSAMDRAVSGFSVNKFFGTERNNLEFPIRLKHSISSLFAQTNSLNIEQRSRLEDDILKGCHLDDYHRHLAVMPSVKYLSQVWDTLLPEVTYSAQVASDFCRQLPGFRCLTIEDQKTITSQAFFGLWIISNSLVYADGEFHFWLGPTRDIKYSSHLMAKFLPEHVVTELVAMSEQLMSLKPSYEELGLLSAVYVTLPIHQGLEDPLRVNALHQCYLWMLRKKLGGRSPLDRQKLLAWLNLLASHAGSLGESVGSILVNGKPPILEEGASQTHHTSLLHSHGNGNQATING